MSEIVLQVPDDALLALKMSPDELGKGAEASSCDKALWTGKTIIWGCSQTGRNAKNTFSIQIGKLWRWYFLP